MTNEEAIKKLEHYRYCLKFQYGWYDKDDDEAIDMAIKALEKTRWILVSERLPEVSDDYIITVFDPVKKYTYVTDAYYRCCPKDDGIKDGDWEGDYLHFWQKVVAWMSLPKPYKAESEE